MSVYLYLAVAIISEVIATLSLRLCEGFTRPVPSALVIAGYAISFYALSFTLKVIPVAIVYAVWSGVGLTLITVAGWLFFKQTLDTPALLGIGIIALGIFVLNRSSALPAH